MNFGKHASALAMALELWATPPDEVSNVIRVDLER